MERAGPLFLSARDPKVEVLELKEDFIKFVLSDTDVSVANALRRVMIGETPTLAIDLVSFKENSSELHDEFLAHRLGMVPVRVNSSKGMDGFKYTKDCFCEDHCPNCSVVFTLDVENKGDEPVKVVGSNDLESNAPSVEAVAYSSQGEVELTETLENEVRGITLVKLAPGQKVKCECIAIKGISKIHAKWCPVSVATYAFEPRIELNDTAVDELTDKQKESFVNSCPTNVFELKGGKIDVAMPSNCMFCDECVKISEPWRKGVEDEPVVVIDTEPNRFVFSVETTGALKPDETVFSALKVLSEKLQLLNRKVDEIQNNGGQQVDLQPGQAGFQDTGGFL